MSVVSRRMHSSDSHPGEGRTDGGFILITLGLLIIPIMIFTSLAVDVSSWYTRAADLQRSADAAALAGVVYMPKIDDAKANATTSLGNNGITFPSKVTNTMMQGKTANSLKVCLTDTSVTQYFAAVFAKPTKITRCATAQYNLPLQIGSPTNSFGGDDTNFPGTPEIPEVLPTDEITNSPTPPEGNYTKHLPNNYATAPYGDGTFLGCKTVTGTGNYGRIFGHYYKTNGDHYVLTSSSNRLDNYRVRTAGYKNNPPAVYAWQVPDCTWTIEGTAGIPAIPASYPIRPDMNPHFWAAVESPGTDAVQGDRYSPLCYGQGFPSGSPDCLHHPNPEHPADAAKNGYFYTLRINAANPTLSLQVFDAGYYNRGSSFVDTGERNLTNNNAGSWNTHFEIMGPDGTPYDPTDNPVLGAGSCGNGTGTNGNNTGSWDLSNDDTSVSGARFKNTWQTLCTLSAPTPTVDDATYVVRVWTTGKGNASNNYALRAVASTTATYDAASYPIDALSDAAQPSLAAWNDMSLNVSSPSATKASFFLAKVTEAYRGKTLVLELYDSAEGADTVTINNPDGIQKGCVYSSAKLRTGENGGNGDSGSTIGSGASGSKGGDCTIATGGTTFNGQLLAIKIQIPDGTDYTCDETLRPTQVDDVNFQGNGCWWTITYSGGSVAGGIHDNTTWGAHIEGDPVRLTQ